MQCKLEEGQVGEEDAVVLYLLGQMEVQLKAMAEGCGSQGNPVTLDSENEDDVKTGGIFLPPNEKENGHQEDCQYLGCTEMEKQEFETCVLSQDSENAKPMLFHHKSPLSPEQLEIIRLVHEGKVRITLPLIACLLLLGILDCSVHVYGRDMVFDEMLFSVQNVFFSGPGGTGEYR